VLGVSSAHVFRSWGKRPPVAGTAADIARTRRSSDWKRLSAGAGTKGPRLHDWCYLELADLEAEPFNSANDGLWTRGLLIRRHIADGDLAFFTTWCPAGTSIERWWRSKATGGRSRTASRPRKTSSGSITTRADHGMAGIARFPGDARLRHDGRDPTSRQSAAAQKNETSYPGKNQGTATPTLIRWSIQEIRPHRHQTRGETVSNPHISSAWSTLAQSSPSCRSASALQSKTGNL